MEISKGDFLWCLFRVGELQWTKNMSKKDATKQTIDEFEKKKQKGGD